MTDYLRGNTLPTTAVGAPTGQVGTITVELRAGATLLLPPTSAGIIEQVPHTYVADLIIPLDAPYGTARAYWDLHDGSDALPDSPITIVASLAPVGGDYTSPQAVRDLLGVDDITLTDAAALLLIQDAQDVIDQALGAWVVDETTGRKIIETAVLAWQWEKLGRATAKTAAALYSTPSLLTSRRYRREKGPDFEVEDPISGGPLAPVLSLLNASGLRRLTGRAVAGYRPRARERRFQVD